MADALRPRLQSFTDSILSHRVVLYTFASTLAVSATVVNALQNQSNFYSVAVYLSKSGPSVLVRIYLYLSVYSSSNLSFSDPRQL
jgi:E3 ubiquitin-protein ligase synoviolin